MQPNACVILPTYNEAENVGRLVPAILAQGRQIPTHTLHVLVVDDNSPDGTQEVVRRLMPQFETLHMITGPKRGLGEAYKRGMAYAMEQLNADIVFEMDADGQHDPSLIPVFTYLADHGFSLIIGSRFAPSGATPEFSRRRRIISLVGNWMIRTLGGLPRIHDCTSGFRCISTRVLRACSLQSLCTRGYAFQSSLLYAMLQGGARVIEVPMVFGPRARGESKLTFQDQVEFLANVVRLRWRRSGQFIRFALVGVSGLLVNLSAYLLLTRWGHLAAAAASPRAIELSILSNFVLNDVWTFRSHQTTVAPHVRLLRFHGVSALAGVLNYLVFVTCVYALHLHDVAAILIGVLAGLLVNYFANSLWTWHRSQSVRQRLVETDFENLPSPSPGM
jgi:dolichol-phosphate mannosyltransferase